MNAAGAGIIEVDHLMTRVDSLAAGVRACERLGFCTTPASHIEAMGLANRLVTFAARTEGAASFIELMAIVDPPRVGETMQRVLAGPQGPKCAVLSTLDAAGCRERAAARGWAYPPVVHVRREWRLPGEESVWPSFDVLLPLPEDLPVSVCQYHTPGLYQRQEWCRHPNTATTLLAVLAISVHPAAAVSRLSGLLGPPGLDSREVSIFRPGRTELRILSPEAAQERLGARVQCPEGALASYLGFSVGVEDLDAAIRLMQGNGVPSTRFEHRAVVAPPHVWGNVLELVQL